MGLRKDLYDQQIILSHDPNNEMDTMRQVLYRLTKELGKEEGREQFEWYCKTYNVDISDIIPPTILWEVFGSSLYPSQYMAYRKKTIKTQKVI